MSDLNTNPILAKATGTSKADVAVEGAVETVTPESESQFAALQSAITEYADTISTGVEGVLEDLGATGDIGDKMLTAVSEVFTSRAIQSNVEDAAELQAQNARIETFEALGGVGGLQSYMKDYASTAKEVQAAQNEVEEIRDAEYTGISLIDNIINDFRVGHSQSKLDAAENRLDNLDGIITNAATQTEGVSRAINQTKKTLNTASILAKNQENAALTAVAVGEQELKNIQNNATALETVMRSKGLAMDAHMKSFSAYNTLQAAEQRKIEFDQGVVEHNNRVEQYKEGREARGVALATAKLNLDAATAVQSDKIPALRATYQQTLKEYEDNLALETYVVGSINKGRAVMNLPPLDVPAAIHGFTSSGATGERHRIWGNIGSSAELSLGSTPADAARTLSAVSEEGFAVEDTPYTKILTQIQDKVITDRAPGTKPPKSVEEANAEFNKAAAEFTVGQAAEVSGTDNIYHAPPMAVLAEYEEVVTSPLYNLVLKPRNLVEVDAAKIVDMSLAAVTEGTITLEEASQGIGAIFKSAVADNNIQKMYHRGGLLHQDTYNIKFKVPKSLAPQRLAAFPKVPVAFFTVGQLMEPTKQAVDMVLGSTFAGDRVTVDLSDDTTRMQLLNLKLVQLKRESGLVIPDAPTITTTE